MNEKKKKTHGVKLLIRMVVRDPDGKIITDTRRKPSKSFVIQFLEGFYGMVAIGASMTATATDGTEDIITFSNTPISSNLRVDAAVNIDVYGVVVGTGDAAESNTDHKLETQLTEGVGAGNITHGESVVETVAVVGANVDLEVKRAFTNLTGSTITVKEAGIYCKQVSGYYHCLVRDVLAASVEVPDKCSLTVIYTLRTTV